MTGKVAKLKYMQVLMVFGVFFVKLHCMLLKNFDEIKSNGNRENGFWWNLPEFLKNFYPSDF
jgi:hypothetical protein